MVHNGLERLLLIEKVLILKSLSIFRDTPENILAECSQFAHVSRSDSCPRADFIPDAKPEAGQYRPAASMHQFQNVTFRRARSLPTLSRRRKA